jgi:hypothetical protein
MIIVLSYFDILLLIILLLLFVVDSGGIPHITQLAAMELTSGKKFSCFIWPKVPISVEAGAITKIAAKEKDGKRVMTYRSQEVPFCSLTIAIDNLCVWLEKCQWRHILFAAHNGRRFDSKVLIDGVTGTGQVDQFCGQV